MKLKGFGSRIFDGDFFVADIGAYGSDHAGFISGFLQNLFHHKGSGSLTLGSGKADDSELFRRMAEPGGSG